MIDDVTWNYGNSLYPTENGINTIIENATWLPYEPAKTPMFLFVGINKFSQLPDSMFLVINKNTALNFVRDTNNEWRRRHGLNQETKY